MSSKEKRLSEFDDETGEGGKSGNVEFRDFLAPDEKKRLLIVHRQTHEFLVEKQKTLNEQRKELKEGKISLPTFNEGRGSGMHAGFKTHPISKMAQFSGSNDQKVSLIPDNYEAETNKENELELKNDYQKRHQPDAPAPQFNPKPQPTGR